MAKLKCLDVNVNRHQDMIQGVENIIEIVGVLLAKWRHWASTCVIPVGHRLPEIKARVQKCMFSLQWGGKKAQVLSKLVDQMFVSREHWSLSAQVQLWNFSPGTGVWEEKYVFQGEGEANGMMLIVNSLFKERLPATPRVRFSTWSEFRNQRRWQRPCDFVSCCK